VDLNLCDGAASAYLNATPNMALSQSPSAERMDAAILSAFVTRTSDEFDILAAPRNPRAFLDTPATIITRILDLACQAYEWVIVDLPRLRQPWTLDVIAGSDEFIVLSELTVPALLAARAFASEIETEVSSSPPPRIVLNRLANRMFAPAPSLSEAQKALGRKAEAGITSDWEAAAASVNLGGVIRRHRPRSKIVRDVDLLVRRLITEPTPKASEQIRAAS
jgi:pilus assembly protein CpaE